MRSRSITCQGAFFIVYHSESSLKKTGKQYKFYSTRDGLWSVTVVHGLFNLSFHLITGYCASSDKK